MVVRSLGSVEVPAPASVAQSTSSDEVDSSKSTPGSPTHALTRLPIRPTSGVSMGSVKFIQTQSF